MGGLMLIGKRMSLQSEKNIGGRLKEINSITSDFGNFILNKNLMSESDDFTSNKHIVLKSENNNNELFLQMMLELFSQLKTLNSGSNISINQSNLKNEFIKQIKVNIQNSYNQNIDNSVRNIFSSIVKNDSFYDDYSIDVVIDNIKNELKKNYNLSFSFDNYLKSSVEKNLNFIQNKNSFYNNTVTRNRAFLFGLEDKKNLPYLSYEQDTHNLIQLEKNDVNLEKNDGSYFYNKTFSKNTVAENINFTNNYFNNKNSSQKFVVDVFKQNLTSNVNNFQPKTFLGYFKSTFDIFKNSNKLSLSFFKNVFDASSNVNKFFDSKNVSNKFNFLSQDFIQNLKNNFVSNYIENSKNELNSNESFLSNNSFQTNLFVRNLNLPHKEEQDDNFYFSTVNSFKNFQEEEKNTFHQNYFDDFFYGNENVLNFRNNVVDSQTDVTNLDYHNNYLLNDFVTENVDGSFYNNYIFDLYNSFTKRLNQFFKQNVENYSDFYSQNKNYNKVLNRQNIFDNSNEYFKNILDIYNHYNSVKNGYLNVFNQIYKNVFGITNRVSNSEKVDFNNIQSFSNLQNFDSSNYDFYDYQQSYFDYLVKNNDVSETYQDFILNQRNFDISKKYESYGSSNINNLLNVGVLKNYFKYGYDFSNLFYESSIYSYRYKNNFENYSSSNKFTYNGADFYHLQNNYLLQNNGFVDNYFENNSYRNNFLNNRNLYLTDFENKIFENEYSLQNDYFYDDSTELLYNNNYNQNNLVENEFNVLDRTKYIQDSKEYINSLNKKYQNITAFYDKVISNTFKTGIFDNIQKFSLHSENNQNFENSYTNEFKSDFVFNAENNFSEQNTYFESGQTVKNLNDYANSTVLNYIENNKKDFYSPFEKIVYYFKNEISKVFKFDFDNNNFVNNTGVRNYTGFINKILNSHKSNNFYLNKNIKLLQKNNFNHSIEKFDYVIKNNARHIENNLNQNGDYVNYFDVFDNKNVFKNQIDLSNNLFDFRNLENKFTLNNENISLNNTSFEKNKNIFKFENKNSFVDHLNYFSYLNKINESENYSYDEQDFSDFTKNDDKIYYLNYFSKLNRFSDVQKKQINVLKSSNVLKFTKENSTNNTLNNFTALNELQNTENSTNIITIQNDDGSYGIKSSLATDFIYEDKNSRNIIYRNERKTDVEEIFNDEKLIENIYDRVSKKINENFDDRVQSIVSDSQKNLVQQNDEQDVYDNDISGNERGFNNIDVDTLFEQIYSRIERELRSERRRIGR